MLEKKVLPDRSKIYRKGHEERKGRSGFLQKIPARFLCVRCAFAVNRFY
jgi:hypothetical protein